MTVAIPMALLLALPPIALLLARVTPRRVQRFLRRFNVPPTDATRQWAKTYLSRTARIRVGGALAGIAVAYATPGAAGVGSYITNPWLAPAVGYLTGAVVGELFTPRLPAPDGAARRRAVTRPRTLKRYVPNQVMRALWIWPAAAAAVAAGSAVVDGADALPMTRVVAMVVVASIFLSGVRWVAQTVVARPQPAVADAALVRADEAVRTASLYKTFAAATALGTLTFAETLLTVSASVAVSGVRQALNFTALVVSVGGLAGWMRSGGPRRGLAARNEHGPET